LLPKVLPVLVALRAAGLKVLMNAGTRDGLGSFKSQFRRADASGAAFALIFGADELAAGQVGVKPLRGDGQQFTRPLDQPASWAGQLRTP